jgi:hypothetical protein
VAIHLNELAIALSTRQGIKSPPVCFFHFMARWGVWDILGLLVALVPSVLVLVYLFPRKAIQNFYIDTKIASHPDNQTYPKVMAVAHENAQNTGYLPSISSTGLRWGPAFGNV